MVHTYVSSSVHWFLLPSPPFFLSSVCHSIHPIKVLLIFSPSVLFPFPMKHPSSPFPSLPFDQCNHRIPILPPPLLFLLLHLLLFLSPYSSASSSSSVSQTVSHLLPTSSLSSIHTMLPACYCLPRCLSLGVPDYHPLAPFVPPSLCLCLCLRLCPCLCLSISLSTCPSLYICLCLSLSACMYPYVFLHLYISPQFLSAYISACIRSFIRQSVPLCIHNSASACVVSACISSSFNRPTRQSVRMRLCFFAAAIYGLGAPLPSAGTFV